MSTLHLLGSTMSTFYLLDLVIFIKFTFLR
jgi:hypothetical protein